LKLERNDKGSLARRKSGQKDKRKIISLTKGKHSKKRKGASPTTVMERRRKLLLEKSRRKRHLPAGVRGRKR
jgi:hypothetical protein